MNSPEKQIENNASHATLECRVQGNTIWMRIGKAGFVLVWFYFAALPWIDVQNHGGIHGQRSSARSLLIRTFISFPCAIMGVVTYRKMRLPEHQGQIIRITSNVVQWERGSGRVSVHPWSELQSVELSKNRIHFMDGTIIELPMLQLSKAIDLIADTQARAMLADASQEWLRTRGILTRYGMLLFFLVFSTVIPLKFADRVPYGKWWDCLLLLPFCMASILTLLWFVVWPQFLFRALERHGAFTRERY